MLVDVDDRYEAYDDPPTLFAVDRTPLRTFRRRMPPHHRRGPLRPDDLAGWVARHAGGVRGRAPSGTVHRMLPDDWLPACGAGLNGWNPEQLTPVDEPVSCGRCEALVEQGRPGEQQLALF
ncbi:hypothetical protein [Amycolatopsis sp. NPDC059021]|uniref:hypothetical protein n=1 Tax=Amycolatopsis sp. NPDC059021 TaxID=3346704 RepID=UPI00366DFAC7